MNTLEFELQPRSSSGNILVDLLELAAAAGFDGNDATLEFWKVVHWLFVGLSARWTAGAVCSAARDCLDQLCYNPSNCHWDMKGHARTHTGYMV